MSELVSSTHHLRTDAKITKSATSLPLHLASQVCQQPTSRLYSGHCRWNKIQRVFEYKAREKHEGLIWQVSFHVSFRPKCNTVRPAGVKKSKKSFQKFWCHAIVCHYFAYNSCGKLKSYHVSLLRYRNPDLHFLGTLKNKLQICQKYELSHHDFVAWGHFRGDMRC